MRRRKAFGVFLILIALVLTQLPPARADAATSPSDFVIRQGKLVKYRGSEKNVEVPDTVTVIGEGAFEENLFVETIILPKSVTAIEPYAFWACNNLKVVVLGSGMREVGDYAFTNATGLKNIVLPSGMERIGIQAFSYCEALEDITIPVTVHNIHKDAFEGDYLLNIHCEPGSYAEDYAKDFYERQKKMPVYGEVNIGFVSGNDVTEPEAEEPTKKPVPGLLYEIPVTGNLLGSTHVVGNRAVVIMQGASLEVLGGESGAEEAQTGTDPEQGGLSWLVPERAYYRRDDVREAVISDDILEIGRFAYARSALSEITFPDGLKQIDYAAFYHCDNLAQVQLPESITSVAPKAFAHTAWVKRFLAGEDPAAGDFLISGGVLIAYRGTGGDVEIPEGVRVIAGDAFADQAQIRKVVIPKSVQGIDQGAFAGCSLEEVEYQGEFLDEQEVRELVVMSSQSAPPDGRAKTLGEIPFRGIWIAVVLLLLSGSYFIVSKPRK